MQHAALPLLHARPHACTFCSCICCTTSYHGGAGHLACGCITFPHGASAVASLRDCIRQPGIVCTSKAAVGLSDAKGVMHLQPGLQQTSSWGMSRLQACHISRPPAKHALYMWGQFLVLACTWAAGHKAYRSLSDSGGCVLHMLTLSPWAAKHVDGAKLPGQRLERPRSAGSPGGSAAVRHLLGPDCPACRLQVPGACPEAPSAH